MTDLNGEGIVLGANRHEARALEAIVVLPLLVLLLFVLALTARSAMAVDGVIEINQVCAAGPGCFSGDAAGYPVEVDGSAGGSYVLTSDLIVPDETTHGIRLDAPNISVDLNGFSIIRAACVGAVNPCVPAGGTGSGVFISTQAHRGTSARNGVIVGMGVYGVQLGAHAEVVNVRARWNRVDGIYVGHGSVVADSSAYGNGRYGILASGSVVNNNSAYSNGVHGFHLSSIASTATDNVARGNGDDGFYAAASTLVGNTAFQNGGDGFELIDGSAIQSCTSRINGGFGINLSTDSTYLQCNVTGNGAGTVNGGISLGASSCNGTGVCP